MYVRPDYDRGAIEEGPLPFSVRTTAISFATELTVADRFREDRTHVWDLGDHFLVHCPKCDRCARVASVGGRAQGAVRLTCAACGVAKDWVCKQPGVLYARNQHLFEEGQVSIGDAVDWYFHLPLWLQTPCCGHTLWAYNIEHLRWLRRFVSAKHRERTYDSKHGWSNQALASRLPRWLQAGGNREVVLKGISRLEERADSWDDAHKGGRRV